MSAARSQARLDADPPGAGGGGAGPARRAASVTFRPQGEGTVGEGSALDPAHQSLSEAIGITFMLLKVAMAVLAVAYLFSGAKQVSESEQGIRLLFGKVEAPRLEPGLHLSMPFPVGEIVKVQATVEPLKVDDVFYPEHNADLDPRTQVDRFTPSTSITPDDGHGALITGDGGLIHTLVTVNAKRSGTAEWAQNISPEHENALLRMAVQRGVVHAVAQFTIDDLLKPVGSTEGAAATLARVEAQRVLDAIPAGITIDALTLEGTMAPLSLKGDFAGALSAEAKAAQAISTARADANKILSSVGGEAATTSFAPDGTMRDSSFIRAINAYESALSRGDSPRAAEALGVVDRLLEGLPAEIDGASVEGQTAGEVATMIADAKQYSSEIVARRKAEVAQFRAKLEQFKANPMVFATREWSQAYAAMHAREFVRLFVLPPGMDTLTLELNRDPDVERSAEMARRQREAKDLENQRNKELEEQKFQTNPLQTAPT